MTTYSSDIKHSVTVDYYHGAEVVTPCAVFDELGTQKVNDWLQVQAGIAQQHINQRDYEKILVELKANGFDNRLRPLLISGSVDYEISQHSSENKPSLYFNDHVHGKRIAINKQNTA